MKLKTLLIAISLAGAASLASADAVKDTIDARRGYYDLIKLNFGGVVAMAKGESEYSPETAELYTNNLVALAGIDVTPLFPEGSDNEARSGDTRALPKIWTDMPGVTEKLVAFQQAVLALDGAAGQGLDALRAQVGPVGETCKSCHETYRAKDF